MRSVFGIIFANYTAAGFGELLSRRTIASLPYGGRYRLVDFPLSNMVNTGIQTVGLIMPSSYRSLIDHVGRGKEWSLDRKTGGLFILPGTVFGYNSTNQKFTISDLIVNHRYIERRENGTDAIIVSANKVYNTDYSEMIKQHHDENRSVTFAFYKDADGNTRPLDCFIVKRDILMNIINGYSGYMHMDIVDLLNKEIPEDEKGTYVYEGYVRSIDTIEDYIAASFDLLDSDFHKKLFRGEKRIFTKIQDEPPTVYGDNAQAINSLVSAGCRIYGKVDNCILFRNITVEEGAVLRNCIVFNHCTVRSGAVIENAVLDKYIDISEKIILSGVPGKTLIIGKNLNL